MRKIILTSLFALSTTTTAFSAPLQVATGPVQAVQKPSQPRHVDLVIALDTSGSMDGLIDSARQKLWDVVNVLGQAKPTPVLRVGLISYGGSTGYDSDKGWVRIESELTTDLDSIYARLFALHTSGGTEYVARAVSDATHRMQWSDDRSALKIVFVAGNEPATQDPKIRVEQAVEEARGKNIFVNTIYCGGQGANEAIGWRNVAEMGHGRYAAIDQNHVVAIATPMDSELQQLSTALNDTYIGYGALGESRKANQVAQDKNASGAGVAAAPSRARAKASSLYRADEWDLVDAKRAGKSLAGLPVASLPEPMRAMKPAERDAFVEAKAKKRAEIQQRINDLSAKREAYVKTERAKKSSGAKDLNDALSESIKAEASSAGFTF